VDPDRMLAKPMDVLQESLQHAQRINKIQQGE
jgi:hypothetical protein